MSVVTFETLKCHHNKKIAIAELNHPKALNALTLEMIEMLHKQLTLWEKDEAISLVILQSSSDKAFCAGGDVVSLYKDIKSNQYNVKPLNDTELKQSRSSEFFEKEYELDLAIHEYSKPIVVWGNGFVMGGGLGLFAGASHRVATEQSLMAMPEVAIGLYPEVGASYFLNNMPDKLGAFLAITGAFFNAGDAKYLGLSNFSIQHAYKNTIIEKLCEIDWLSEEAPQKKVDEVLNFFDSLSETAKAIPDSSIKLNHAIINRLMTKEHVEDIYDEIVQASFKDKWLQDAQNKLKKASVLSVKLAYKQLDISAQYNKTQCFEAELNLSRRCCQHPELEEGIRAQLIDKDKCPQWTYQHCKDIEPELISWFFSPI